MTKKRFIKLLMSKGIARNEANLYAWFAWRTQTPYVVEIQDDFYNEIKTVKSKRYIIKKTMRDKMNVWIGG